MATRSIIKIEGVEYAEIYKHWDGYPEAMAQWLTDFNKEFTDKRGNDPAYRFAQLLRFSIVKANKYKLGKSLETGWGVVPYNSYMAREYEYILNIDGTVTINKI